MSQSVRRRRAWLRGTCSWRWASVAAAALGVIAAVPADAGQLPASLFQVYNPANASTIQPGPFALYTVPVDSIAPTQMNEGFQEVDKKTTGFDILQPSQLGTTAGLLTDIEPVVIGPGGQLYLTDGHHTFTALENSAYGASNPTVYVNVIANFSNLTTQEFWAQMQADDLLLPLNDGVAQTVNTATGSPIPPSLTGLTPDVYRGLEYSILKNKNSKLFPSSSNIAGVTGSSIPGLDKITGLYGDFIWADAYRNANNGLGLPYLSPGDIQIATQWNLNPNSQTTEPNVGTVKVGQLPGAILSGNIVINGTIGNATLANGTLDGTATGTFDETSSFASFDGITQFNLGTPSNPIMVGAPQSGFVMQLGADSGHTVTLNGNNTYTGGTTIIAGTLIVNGDAALGAAAPANYTIDPNSILSSVHGANGIVFDSLSEGSGTLETTSSFSTNRPIAVDGEVANLEPASATTLTLTGQIVSLGTAGDGLGNATGISDITINGASNSTSTVVLAPSAAAGNPLFYGSWIITGGTLNVSSDAALGATTLSADELGQIVLNGGTFQAGASFSSARTVSVQSKSTFDTKSFATSFSGGLSDNQRNLSVTNTGSGAGSVTFGSFQLGSAVELTVGKGTGTGTSVTFTDGITRESNAVLLLTAASGSTLGGTAQVFSSGSSTTLDPSGNPSIVAPWIIIDTPANNSPYDFAAYSATNGYTAFAGYTTSIGSSTASTVDKLSGTVTLAGAASAYAVDVQRATTLNGSGLTLTIGDGTNPAGLILNGTNSNTVNINVSTLAFGGSEGIIYTAGSQTSAVANVINSQITGAGGLTFSGTGMATIKTASTETGAIVVDSSTLNLAAANAFASSTSGVLLADTKNLATANLTFNQSQAFSALNSAGNNSTIIIDATGTGGGSGATALTVGNAENLNSTISSIVLQTTATAATGSAISNPTGNAVTGIITKNGTGLLDMSGMKSGTLDLVAGSTIVVNAGALRLDANSFLNPNGISVAAGAELQFAEGGGARFGGAISGAGVLHLVGGTLQLTGTNSYAGGTVIETGAVLDVTTANLPSTGAISNAGGTLVFDQTQTGTFGGIMNDGQQAGGPSDPNDVSCTLVSCTTATLSGTLIKDDSATGSGGNVTLSQQQAYSGMTYIEAGTLTLGAVDTIKSSAGVDLGRVGGAVCNPSPCTGVTATLALGADNTIQGLSDDAGNSTQVTLNGHTLTLAPISGSSWTYAGAIVDGSGSGGLVQDGPGTSILTGTSTYSGATAVDAGTLEVDGTIAASSGFTIGSGGTLVGIGNIDPPTMTVMSGGTFAPGTPGVPGTSMTVTGNLAFQSGADYLVQLNPTTSTYANVTGTAALSGNVLAAFQSGGYTVKQYTILQSAGLNGTTFTALGTTNLPSNFTATLSYSSDDVFLNLNAVLGRSGGANGNDQNVANALNNYFNSGGTLTPNFASLFALSGGNLNTALAQLSGEANTAGENASFAMMSDFLGVMVDPTAGGRGGAPGSAGNAFAAEQSGALPPDIASAYAAVLKRPPPPAPFEQRWTAWGQGFGGYNRTDGNAAAGTNTVTATAFGFAGGLDYHFSADSYAGFAIAGSGSDWSLAQNLGTGRSNSLQLGLYGTSYFGRAYVAGSIGIANNWMTTNRTAALGDQLSASFNAQSYGARLEGGYRYGIAQLGVTPYAALQTQLFHTPAYSETDLSGGGFGLSYAASNPTDTRSELGARFDSLQVVNNMPLVWRARLAWAHDWVSSPTLTAAFQTLPGANFVVNGAGMPANSALAALGAELYMTRNWSVEAKFDGNFANTAQTYAGTGTIRYRW